MQEANKGIHPRSRWGSSHGKDKRVKSMFTKSFFKKTIGLLLCAPFLAMAQPNIQLTDDALAKAQEAANHHSVIINDAWIATKRSQVNQDLMKFNFDNLPKTAIKELPDIGKMVESYKLEMQPLPEHSIYKTVVFLSFSMPDESIRKILEEVSPIREEVVFVLRGFDESKDMLKTVQRINGLIGSNHAQVNIDPEKFERFGIHSAPAFVVYRDDPAAEHQCILEGRDVEEIRSEFVGVYGDTSLEYALSYLEKNTSHTELKKHISKQVKNLSGLN